LWRWALHFCKAHQRFFPWYPMSIWWVSTGYHGKPSTIWFLRHVKPLRMGFTRIRPTLGSISQGPYSCKALERLTLLGENWSNFVSVCGGCITLGKISAIREDGTSMEGASSPSQNKIISV
jgi:hypothetical protein